MDGNTAPGDRPGVACGRRFVDRLTDWGDRPAVLDRRGRILDYRALAGEVDAFTRRLGSERRLVVIEATLDCATVVAYLGAMAGRHPVLLSPPGETASALAASYGAGWLVTAGGRLLRRRGKTALHPDLALLLSTSGSTGSPRLVRLSTANVESNAAAIGTALALTEDDRGALTLPLHYSYGLSILNSHLAAGASLYLSDRPITDPRFIDDLAMAGCTNLSGVPLSYALFERIGLRDRAWPALRFMTAAGGRLDPDLVRSYARFMAGRGGRFYAMYGQTEATARIAVLPPDQALTAAGTIGRPLAGGTLTLIDDHGREIQGPGQTGELAYSGPNVMMGYAENPADLALGRTIDRLMTGDLAERDGTGALRVTGRRSRFSKPAGLRIDHDRVERQLLAAGFAAAVTGDDRRLVVAALRPASEAALHHAAQQATGLAALQIQPMVLDGLPQLPSGKVDYAALRRQADLRATDHDRPDSVAAAFAAAFAPRPVTADDSFTSLGGDSVIHVTLALALERQLGHLPTGWERRRIAALEADRDGPPAGLCRRVDTTTLVRVAAILLVALHHATQWPLPGGAAILMILVGHSLARFQFGALTAGRLVQVARPALRNIGLYYLLLVPLMLAEHRWDWPSLLLLGNTPLGDPARADTPFVIFWFVEAYAQLLLVILGLFAIPPIRRRVARDPFGAGLVALAAGLVLRLITPSLVDFGRLEPMATPMVAHLAALGWCAACADSRWRRLVVFGLSVAIFPSLPVIEEARWIGLWIKPAIVLTALVLLLYIETVPLPRPAARTITRLAAASYVIYLVHGLPAHVLLPLLPDWPQAARAAIAFAGGLAFGVICHAAIRPVSAIAGRARTGARAAAETETAA